MTQVSRNGVTVTVPNGWEAELIDHPGNRVVLHMSDGPLPSKRSDFGGHAVEELTDARVFISVLEYDPTEANVGLFRKSGLPSFVPGDFAPNQLHRYVRGQTAAQKFFTYGDRTFCAYVVIAKTTPSVADSARVNQTLNGFSLATFQ